MTITSTKQTPGHLAISSEGVAGIYEKLGSRENLEHARELYDRGFTIKQQLAEELGTPRAQEIFLSVTLMLPGYWKSYAATTILRRRKSYIRKHLQ